MTPCTVRGEAYSPPTMSSVYRVPCNQTGSCWSKRQCSDFSQLIRPLSSLSSMLTAARETLETLRTQALLPDNSAGIEPILQKSGPHLCFLKFNGNNFFKFYVSMMLWFSWGWSLSVCALWHAQSGKLEFTEAERMDLLGYQLYWARERDKTRIGFDDFLSDAVACLTTCSFDLVTINSAHVPFRKSPNHSAKLLLLLLLPNLYLKLKGDGIYTVTLCV